MANEQETVGVNRIAQLLKQTPQRINQLVNEGVLPRVAHGKYNEIACVHAYIDHLRERAGPSAAASDTFSAERAKLTKARAQIAELERQHMAGELAPVAEMQDVYAAAIQMAKTRLLAIPARVAPAVVATRNAVEAKNLIQTQIREALAELSSGDSLKH